MATLQSAADADDEKILRGWQKLGAIQYQVPMNLEPNMHTSQFATGKMISYDVLNGSTLYYSAARRVSLANSTNTALEGLIAKGATALVIEGAMAPADWETSKSDAKDRRSSSVSRPLWSSFYQAKRQFSEDLSRDTVRNFVIERG
jgi:hypothetical protein